MRIVMLALGLLLAVGCGEADDHPGVPLCPPGAEGVATARCTPGVDHGCDSGHGYVCACLCTGYWECDQVLPICDAGVPDLSLRDLASSD